MMETEPVAGRLVTTTEEGAALSTVRKDVRVDLARAETEATASSEAEDEVEAPSTDLVVMLVSDTQPWAEAELRPVRTRAERSSPLVPKLPEQASNVTERDPVEGELPRIDAVITREL